MKNILSSLLVCIGISGAALAEDDFTFDVEGGFFEVLSEGRMDSNLAIYCRFSIQGRDGDDVWVPSVSVLFKEDDEGVKEENVKVARLSAYYSEESGGWRHEFTMRKPVNRESEFVAHTATTDAPLPLFLVSSDDDYIAYYVGDDEVAFSVVDVADMPLKTWQVIASGVEGSANCTLQLLDELSAE